MSDLLQTILFGTFLPPDVPGRKISFDDPKKTLWDLPVAKRKVASNDAVIEALQNSKEWLSVTAVSRLSGICYDTSKKVLNRLASDHTVSKRFVNSPKQGHKTAVFRWINKNAKKQKTT